jgi:hypothetical protein
MKESEFSNQIKLKITEFETIADIHPSAEWNNNLMVKLESANQHSRSGLNSASVIIVVLLIVLVNIGLILGSIGRTPIHSQIRDKELGVVKNEFLINPVSINN